MPDYATHIAIQTLTLLRAGDPPWRWPHERGPELSAMFGKYGAARRNNQGVVDYSEADSLIAATGAKITHHWRCQRPRCERPPKDKIVLPPRSRFMDDRQYMATKFHEIIHFLETPWRVGWIGSDHQAELVAEVGTGFLESHLGLPHETDNTNIWKWLPAWADHIECDPGYLHGAVRQAQKSVEFILGLRRRSSGGTANRNGTGDEAA